jgi:ribosomal protein S18 acetylase RimI-like enzyme
LIIKKCTEISKEKLHQLSLEAYKDYLVDVSMDYDTFYNHFIDYSDIDLSKSFVAIIDSQPVGFILGSINHYEGIKTLRCAAFAVLKDYRNQKVGRELFKKHLETGIETNCERLFLEVIKENKAKSFYLREGYQIIDELFYYTLALNEHHFEKNIPINFIAISNNEMNDYLINNKVHINYQNHPIILKNSMENKYFKLMHQDKNIGVISYDSSGRLSILYLKNDYQKIEYLNSIFHDIKSNENFDKIRLSVTSEMHYISLFKAVGFKKEPIEQFEMIKKL